MGTALGIGIGIPFPTSSGPQTTPGGNLLKEDDDFILLETGDQIVKEQQ